MCRDLMTDKFAALKLTQPQETFQSVFVTGLPLGMKYS